MPSPKGDRFDYDVRDIPRSDDEEIEFMMKPSLGPQEFVGGCRTGTHYDPDPMQQDPITGACDCGSTNPYPGHPVLSTYNPNPGSPC